MIENHLTEELEVFISEAVADFRLPVKNGEMRAPKVIDGYLPPKRSGADDDFPFIVVRSESGVCEGGKTTVTVAFIIGCYTEEVDGYRYCLNVMSRIKNALTMLPNGTLANKYQLEFPIEWSLVPEQPYPYWQLDMMTKWVYNTPQFEVGEI